MGKKKTGTKYADDATITKNKAARLARHLKKHPNDLQSGSAVGNITIQGGKKPTGKGLRDNTPIARFVTKINKSVQREMVYSVNKPKEDKQGRLVQK